MSDIKSNMSIPEFMKLLDLELLRMVKKMEQEKIDRITVQEKVEIWLLSCGMFNEGFYRTKEEALQAARDYVNSKEYSIHDSISITKHYEYVDEAERFFNE